MKKTLAALTALGMLATATPALAAVNSSSLVISNSNNGTVSSNTNAVSNTGLNLAGGSTGGNGSNGGNSGAANMGGENGDANSGNAGNGGNGGNGGWVETGDAHANAAAVNGANSNDTRVSVRGGLNSSSATVEQDNVGDIEQDTNALASTGLNLAQGSEGGSGDNGGNSGTATKTGNQGDANTGTGGAGGHGGAGGEGGTVKTGVSRSNSGAVNVLNTNFLRVRI